MRTLRHVVADIAEALGAHASDEIHSLVAAVAGRDNIVARFGVRAEQRPAFHPAGDLDARKCQRRRGHVNVSHQVFPHQAGLDPARRSYYERHPGALLAEELLAAGVADAVIGEKEHHRVVGHSLALQAVQDLADLPIHVLDRLQILRPVLADCRVIRVVGWQLDLLRVNAVSLYALDRLQRALVAKLPAPQLDLSEERLVASAASPVRPIVEIRGVLEVVVRLALGEGAIGAVAAVGNEIAGPAHDRRGRFDIVGEMDLEVSPSAAVIVGTDRGLVHPRNQC